MRRQRVLWFMAAGALGLIIGCSDDAAQPDASAGAEDTPSLCQDKKDNDGDGKIDCADPDCGQLVFCQKDAGADGPLGDAPASDAPISDGPATDGPSTDGGGLLPGCSIPCAKDQVCLKGACTTPGPSAACGAAPYGDNLPASGVVYVDGSHTGASDGKKATPFTTLAAALPKVMAGGTLAVADGTYEEALTLDKSIDLRCRCASKVVIAGQINIKPSAKVTVRIIGCHVRPKGKPNAPAGWGACDSSEEPKGIRAVGAAGGDVRLLIKDSLVSQWCHGVYFNLAPGSTSSLCISNTKLMANVRGLDVQQAPKTTLAAPFSECPTAADSVTLRLSQVAQNRAFGVHTRQGATAITLQGNVVSSTGKLGSATAGADEGYGVYLGNTESTTVSGNRVEGNLRAGIGLRNLTTLKGTGIQIADNVVNGNGGAGIALQQLQSTQAVKVTGNRVSATAKSGGKDGDGIQVSVVGGTAFDVEVSGNTVSGSGRNGVLLDGVGGSVKGNTLKGNGGYGALVQGGSATIGSNTYGANASGASKSSSSKLDLLSNLPVPIP